MSGHSHWSNIKHKKAAVDAKRGKVWSKLSKAIIVAAKQGGGDPDMNLRLRYAIDAAKAVSMPKENIQRAIKTRHRRDRTGGDLEEVLYEGYGPGGVAILCEVLTDNRNRTATGHPQDLRTLRRQARRHRLRRLDVREQGALPRRRPTRPTRTSSLEIALEAGADDVKRDGDNFAGHLRSGRLSPGLQGAGRGGHRAARSARSPACPRTRSTLDAETARKVLKLMERLDDHDDVQSVVRQFQHSRRGDGGDRRGMRLRETP